MTSHKRRAEALGEHWGGGGERVGSQGLGGRCRVVVTAVSDMQALPTRACMHVCGSHYRTATCTSITHKPLAKISLLLPPAP